MEYGYYIKIDKNFNLTDALTLLSCQKYAGDNHDFSNVYNTWKRLHDRDYLVIYNGIFKPEYYESDTLKSLIEYHDDCKWTELKLNYKDLGEL